MEARAKRLRMNAEAFPVRGFALVAGAALLTCAPSRLSAEELEVIKAEKRRRREKLRELLLGSFAPAPETAALATSDADLPPVDEAAPRLGIL